MKRNGNSLKKIWYQKKEYSIKQILMWREMEIHKTIFHLKLNIKSRILTSAQCSTRYWTISIDFIFIATLSGHIFIQEKFDNIMINMKSKWIL